MKDFTTYLSTAPVVAIVWLTFSAALIIEINRFFPEQYEYSNRLVSTELQILKFNPTKFVYQINNLSSYRNLTY